LVEMLLGACDVPGSKSPADVRCTAERRFNGRDERRMSIALSGTVT